MQLTEQQEREAKNDLLLADIDLRLEQVRQMKTYEAWKLAFAGVTAGAALFAAGAAFVKLIGG